MFYNVTAPITPTSQRMVGGGSFGTGFASGAVGNLTGSLGGDDYIQSVGLAGLGAGVTAWASGGDFVQGFQSGAYNMMYNKFGDHIRGMAEKAGQNLLKGIQKIPSWGYDLGAVATLEFPPVSLSLCTLGAVKTAADIRNSNSQDSKMEGVGSLVLTGISLLPVGKGAKAVQYVRGIAGPFVYDVLASIRKNK